MNFSLSPSAGRRGRLLLAGKPAIATPGCLLNCVKGAVPHLTPDMLSRTGPRTVQVPLAHFADRSPSAPETFDGTLAKFLNAEAYTVIGDLLDVAAEQPEASCSDKFVTVRTLAGLRKVSTKDYAAMMHGYNPDICVAPSDPIWAAETLPSRSRANKASRRTMRLLDQFLAEMQSKPVLAVLQGSHYPEERVQSAIESSKRNVDGFVMNLRGLSSTEANVDNTVSTQLSALLLHSTSNIPMDKPRFAFGVSSIDQVLEAIQAGVDLFDATFILWTTEKGHALHMNLGDSKAGSASYQVLDLWSTDRRRDFKPFVESCQCFACTRHTRAYCHHLLQTHEMLGHVLLMCHNAYQYDQFFAQIRAHLDADTFDDACTAFMTIYQNTPQLEATGTTKPQVRQRFEI
ncbi:tRNA-guanine(15) transglycosylase-like protein [Syncephalis fuscata]|nr:tRNA-guanine(15) transglycosylase-like protein [Syncephalis fuscata]